MSSQSRVEILSTRDDGHWNEILEEAGHYDFHHLPSYHRLAEMRGEGDAFMVAYREGKHVIALPLLLRDIDLATAPTLQGAGYKDASSVHGYVGPVASAQTPADVARHFADSLQEFYESHDVVSAFSRLHPLIDQSSLLREYGETVDIGVTTSIDLTVPSDVQIARYKKGHRYETTRLRKLGFTCEQAGLEHLDDFVRIYQRAMRELDADPFYHYDKAYFEDLIGEMSDAIHLFVCKDGDQIACVGLFGACCGIIQYHLAGTVAEYRRLAPMKLMLDTVRVWANEMGAHTFHLGGGVGAKRDSLYEFKMGFCGREHVYSAWRHVVNRAAYADLCCAARRSSDAEPDGSYFPVYRHPVLRKDGASVS